MITMHNPSIDSLLDKVTNPKTREYLREVINSFYNGNYRSTIVMLCSTVICDILYKLEELSDVYGDTTATAILNDVKTKQEQNSNSPEWENTLIDSCKQQRRILEPSEYNNVDALKKLRNLCAHPVLKESNDLYQPNKYAVQGHIIEMLEGVLTKPSLVLQNIFQSFIVDVAAKKATLGEGDDMLAYVTSQYLNKLNGTEYEYKLFKPLWKIVMECSDKDATDNRTVNYNILRLLYLRNRDSLAPLILGNKEYFGSHININDYAFEFIRFINEFQEMWKYLPEGARITVTSSIKADTNLTQLAFFMSPDLGQHLTTISQPNIDTAYYLYEVAAGCLGKAYAQDFAINVYAGSSSYDRADEYYDDLVSPHLSEYSISQLKKLLDESERNSQIYDRRKFSSSYRAIRYQIQSIDPQFDFSKYPNQERNK